MKKPALFSQAFSPTAPPILPRFLMIFLSAAKPSDLGTLGVVLVVLVVVVGGGPLLELTHEQFFRGVFKTCQIF